MNDLVTVEYGEPLTTSFLIAEGVDNQHKNVIELIKRHSGTKTLSALQTRKIKTKGRPTEVYLLNEKQATFLITLMKNSEKVLQFKERLVDDFYDMKNRLAAVAINQQSAEWNEARSQGKLSRREGTDVIAEFVEYAKAQGSTSSGTYYMSISRMENKLGAAWFP